MQKIMFSILTLGISLQFAYADPQAESMELPNIENKEVSIEQKNIVDLMQRNLQFESEKLHIENQITLAKLKKELKEVNEILNESPSQETVATKELDNDVEEQRINELMDTPVKSMDKPKVIMISYVAGIKKIGVVNSENSRISFVSENKPFSMNGMRYRVILKNNQYKVVD
ncbi:hypothetical protein LHV16_18455 [Providencia rettgeri]|uniref:hypothetical protein n=3 Tax=Providencia TaxID=586 RepID=UPI0016566986|nr:MULTISPECIES: hypothetical protein [Providencia]MBC8653594.1 hypothetical protein [Providencia vermicola]EJD6374928.1 hypothetical protein [Providencia rettgeri]ELR5033609.1 hypothetical protein [Providencia rettgeri]ELR5158775.1 hypothetical protein [Providencia rettgeri]ELR5209479.1 hypothetical protein [Providencia rettgeri]